MTPADWSNCSFRDYSNRSHPDVDGAPVGGEGLFGQRCVVRLPQGGRPRTFTLPERREIKKIAKSKPAEHGLPFST
jgi:hypothetical protein